MAMVFGRTALHRLPLGPALTYSSISPSRISAILCHSPPVPRFQIRAVYSESKLKEITQPQEERLSNTWKIKMLYDGECPLCMREVNMLRERNQAYGTIKFVDISSDDYSPEENQGLDYKTAFRRLYEEVGLGWVYAITKYKPISTIANGIYGIWAAYRLQLTGRPSLEKILDSKKKLTEGACNDDKVCKK